MKAIKVIGLIVLLLVIGLAVALWYGLRNLDALVQGAIETYGTEVTGTQVAVEQVSIELQQGRAQLGPLTIANPEGFSTDYAFALNDIVLQVDPQSIGTGPGDVIVIDEITVNGARITAELQGLRNNLQVLAENVQKQLPAGESTSEPEPGADYVGPNFRVERFEFSEAAIDLVSDRFGERSIAMPTVRASNLGGSQGVPPQELGAVLMQEVLNQAIAAVKAEVGDAAEREVRSRVEEKINENISEEEQQKLDGLRDLLNR